MQERAHDDDRVMDLVEQSLARPSEERESYLRSECAGDSNLFDKVWHYVQWEQRMGGFLLESLCSTASESHFQPGELLDDRFRVVREVAQGGMGVVYEAVDEKLERRIAIKCAKIGYRTRLSPEVRNAREISHPNVCRIFEIHTASTEQGDIEFLAMEFLDGETLAERLRRGALPGNEARVVARQLCAGLAEAHRHQVIHGDLKPANVILTKGTDGAIRAVITDFGMARVADASQHSAQPGSGGGTPDYMAPELWKGEKASVASDIYALGVILYELASGRRPFTAELAWQDRTARKTPSIDAKWDRILARTLDPDPAKRYRSADEVAHAFEPSHTRRWLLGAAAAVVVAASSAVATYRHTTGPQESVRLAVLPFTSDPDSASIAEDLSRNAQSQVARLTGDSRTKLTVIPPGGSTSATHVLHGTIQKTSGNLIVKAVLTDRRSGVDGREWKAVYAPGQERYAGVALAGMVTGTLHVRPMIVASVNSAARQDYLTALPYLRTNIRVDEAVRLLERAVAADPDSPLPYAALAEAEYLKYFLGDGNQWQERMVRSIAEAEKRNADVAEVRLISGLAKMNAGWYELAEADYQRAIELQPNNSDGYRRLANLLKRRSQMSEALTLLQKALQLDPNYFRLRQDLGAFYLEQGRFSEAAPHYAKAVELAPNEPHAHFLLAYAYEDLGRFAEAENELRVSIGIKETPNAVETLGVVLMYEQREAEAIPVFLRCLQLTPDRYRVWMDLGICYRRINRVAEAAAANRRGLEAAEVEMAKNPRDGYARAYLAYLCAATGAYRRAESEIAQALQLSHNANTRFIAALTYELMDRRDSTLTILSAAAPGTLADLSRWPDVAELRQDPRFMQMLGNSQIQTRR